jgi:NADPH:quinone reductase-like Zn-dependent oxidoreductase
MAVSQLFVGLIADQTQLRKPASVHRLELPQAAVAERHEQAALPLTMTAARINHLGPPQIIGIGSIEVPQPGELEVLVRVQAAGVGPWDALIRTGKSGLPLTPPLTLGAEISGIVEKVGAKTTGFAPGDAVFGATNPLFIGGYAEYAVVTARMIAKKPAALSDIEAAALPVAGVMAWQMLFDHAAVRAGQTIVVHGGAGNVGAYAVQLARANKLRVIATIHRGDANFVRALGADEVIDMADNLADFARCADAVIDTVGGAAQDALFDLVKPGGSVVSSVARPSARLALSKRVRADYFVVDVNTAALTRLAQLRESKELTVPVGTVLPLGEVRAAHEMLAGTRAHRRGKIVLRVAG